MRCSLLQSTLSTLRKCPSTGSCTARVALQATARPLRSRGRTGQKSRAITFSHPHTSPHQWKPPRMALSSESARQTADWEQITSQLQSLGISELPQPAGVLLHPQRNPIDIYRAVIIDQLHRITGAEPEVIKNAVAWTQDQKHGDLVLPVPALRLQGKKADELAAEIAEKFESPLIEKPSVDKSSVRFFFKPEPLARFVLPAIHQQKGNYGFNPTLGLEDPSNLQSRHKKVVVEYSSPNVAKEFHTGHLRSTIIGGFLVKMFERAGWEAISMNYLGDWGKQYGILSEGFEKYGDENELLKDPVKHLNTVYVKINQDHAAEQKPASILAEKRAELEKLKHPPKAKKPAKGKEAETSAAPKWSDEQEQELQRVTAELEKVQQELVNKPSIDEKARRFFKRMVDGDEAALKNWQKFRDESIKAYEGMYSRLNIKFDDYSGESTVRVEDMERVAAVLAEKKISEEDRGAVIVDLSKHGLPALGKTLVKKSDGTSLYLTRDLAANLERYEKYQFDHMIYVIASQQDVHVKQLFAILRLMGAPYSEVVAKCSNISFGMVKDPKGQTMSTRKGTVISLADSLDAAKDFMHDVMRRNADKYQQVDAPEATADTLAISAIMVQDYSGKMVNGYNFDLDKMCSFEGDTGPYLQYSHARLCSIKRKAGVSAEEMQQADVGGLLGGGGGAAEGIALVRSLAQWPDVFLHTYKTREPVTVLTYLFKMAHLLSSCYDAVDRNNKNAKTLSVMYAESVEKKRALMAMYEAARIVLCNGMQLLGLSPVERM